MRTLGAPLVGLDEELESAKLERSIQQQIDEIEAHNANARFPQALQQIEAARSISSDSRLDQLQQAAQAGIDRAESERREAEATRRQVQARIKEANQRQRTRRRSYTNYLSSVEFALSRDDNESARRWLESARALQINDQSLLELDRRVELAEEFASSPLTDYEIRYAASRFAALKDAIEARNTLLIEQLSEGQPSKKNFVDTLLARYRQLSVSIVDVKSAQSPKRVTAILRIDALGLPNGDIVYPSQAYRDLSLSLRRGRYRWSKIEW